ncbi:MAG: LruC domain-containing protein [Ichthyobacteriaceae bacterium]|nr:LruC domain-containing protein [Ichthyobacteriaceae bacterium]
MITVFLKLSCTKDLDNETNIADKTQSGLISELGVTIPNSFDFVSTKKVTVNVKSLKNDNSPSVNNKINFYKSAPDINNHFNTIPFATLYTNNNGVVTGTFSIASEINTLYAQTNTLGRNTVNKIDVSNNSADIVFGGIDPNASKRNLSIINAVDTTVSNIKYIYLNNYYTDGKPTNMLFDVLSDGFIARISATLPETKSVSLLNKHFLTEGNGPNLELIKSVNELDISFVHEGASMYNSLGFYFYNTSNPPQSKSDIERIYIAIPNSSFYNSGGGLNSGDKIEVYPHPKIDTEEGFVDSIPAGTGIGWVVIQNGWTYNESKMNYRKRNIFASQILNPETGNDEGGVAQNIHALEFKDDIYEKNIIGFEDLNRKDDKSDNDFNDIVFYVTTNDYSAVDNTETPEIVDPTLDCDGDGVPDYKDEYGNDYDGCDDINDDKKAFNNYTNGTLAWEDLWPNKGDYDFNDLVVDYKINEITNKYNKITFIEFEIDITAIGASFKNGLAFELPIPPSYIKSVTGTVRSLDQQYLSLNANGTENGQTNAVIFICENAYDLLNNPNQKMVNVYPQTNYIDIPSLKIVVELNTFITIKELGGAPYNPFIVKNANRDIEIHLAGMPPTDLANIKMFGFADDDSSPAEGRYYKTDVNLPWAIHIPTKFDHMIETKMIHTGHYKFADWAASGGSSFVDWYHDLAGYRNNYNIYIKP